jgi:hypothetical protein
VDRPLNLYYLIENVSGRLVVLSETTSIPTKKPGQMIVKNLDKLPVYVAPVVPESSNWNWNILSLEEKNNVLELYKNKSYREIGAILYNRKITSRKLCCTELVKEVDKNIVNI